MDWLTLTDEQWFTAAVALSAACVGGLATLIGSTVVLAIERLIQARSEKKRLLTRSKALALRALIKLNAIADDLFSTKVLIDELFEENRSRSQPTYEVAEIIRPIVGLTNDFSSIDAEEIDFLVDIGRASLISEIFYIERRHRVFLKSLTEYNDMRHNLNTFIASCGIEKVDPDGAITLNLSRQEKNNIDQKLIGLNQIAAKLVESVEEDLGKTKSAIKSFISASRDKFGSEWKLNVLEEDQPHK